MTTITDQQLELFMSLFRGRKDVYARRWEKEGRSGYSPAYDFNWNEFWAHKRRGGSMKDFENKKPLPLTKEVVRQHILGQHIVGIYPILTDNTSWDCCLIRFLRKRQESRCNLYWLLHQLSCFSLVRTLFNASFFVLCVRFPLFLVFRTHFSFGISWRNRCW